MPTKKPRRRKRSNREKVLAYLRENPGHHRCVEIAQATGMDTHAAAVAARSLAVDTGMAVRGLRPAENGRRPFNTYAASEKALETVGAEGQAGG